MRHLLLAALLLGGAIAPAAQAPAPAYLFTCFVDNGEDGLHWDRSTLYALRGVFAAGDTERALPRLSADTHRRLPGEHVPYAVEA